MVSDTYKLESNGQVKLSIYQATGLYPIENGSNESWIKHNASLRKVCEKLNKHILEYVHPVFSLRRSPTKQVITSSVQHQSSLKAVVSLNCMSLK